MTPGETGGPSPEEMGIKEEHARADQDEVMEDKARKIPDGTPRDVHRNPVFKEEGVKVEVDKSTEVPARHEEHGRQDVKDAIANSKARKTPDGKVPNPDHANPVFNEEKGKQGENK